jgi:hypothetical protein
MNDRILAIGVWIIIAIVLVIVIKKLWVIQKTINATKL